MSSSSDYPADAIREDFIPKDPYFDRAFARLEAERLWPKVWQIACRLEEIPEVGDYVTYEILQDSIMVVRTSAHDVRAFHNACPHRGNQLTEGHGNTRQFVCSFHGWRFALDGRNVHVVDRKDWGDRLCNDDVRLKPVRVGVWGGWVFINMDPECQALEQFLEPMASHCDRFEFDKLRFAWYRSTVVAANWKTVVPGVHRVLSRANDAPADAHVHARRFHQSGHGAAWLDFL